MQVTSSWGGVFQDITSLTPGAQISVGAYAGTHNPNGYYAAFGVEFYNSSWTYISGQEVEVNSLLPTMTYYQFNITVPAGTAYTRVLGKANGDWIKLDGVCVKTLCNSTITGLFFNDLKGTNDISISNNGYYPMNDISKDYNLEASVTGNPGSVKFTITGAQNTSNIENQVPWNHPTTNTAWAPVLGTYTVTVQVYSGPNATGVICDEKTFTFTLYCDPENSNGPPFCAPEPDCISGNSFLWSQTINSNTGNGQTLSTLYCGGTTTYTIPGPYPTAFNGPVTVNITDVVSFDGYVGRNTKSQPNEKWRIQFKKSGAVVWSSTFTGDVPDLVTQGYWRGTLGSAFLPNGADQIIIQHWSVVNDCNSPNSVVPVSVCIEYTACNNATNGGTIAANQSACVNAGGSFDPAPFTNVTSPSGGSGPLEYIWIMSTTNCPPATFNSNMWTTISGATSATYDPGPITQTTCYRRCARRAGCTEYDAESNIVTVTINTAPNATASASPATICSGQSSTITATGGGTYLWSTGQTTAAITVSPTNTTTYTVTETGANGCPKTATATVTVNPLPNATASASPATICTGHSSKISSRGGGSYLWSTGQTTAAITVSPTNTTTYTVTVTGANGCTKTATATMTVNPLPNATATASPTTICAGQSSTLTATGGGTYLWSTGATTATTTVNPTSTTTYTVTVTGTNGCTKTATTTVVTDNGSTTVTGPGTTCTNTFSYQVCQTGNAISHWILQLPACFNTNDIQSVLIDGVPHSSWVLGMDGACNFYGLKWDNIQIPNGQCKTLTVVFTQAYAVQTVSWMSKFSSCCQPGSANGPSCTPANTASINGNGTICNGQSTTLTATGGATYLWSTGQTTAVITVSPTTTTTYTVTATSAEGCTSTATKLVTVNPAPNAAISGPTSICTGSSATLTASGGGTYLWSTGQTTAAITVSPTNTTTYTVTVTGA
ncbi:MAG: hypothetical protein JNK89_11215, partial [Saprospiraceae bacterium]|nr:hypothetical protein [Saprospiraceae bacterium]